MNNPEQISDQYGTTEHQASNEPSAIDLDDASLYLNRELTWLAFNRRVLAEATREKNPLLERVKFLAIVSNNLDEFFMKRIGGLKQQVAAGISVPSVDGRTPMQQLEECHKVTREMQQTQEQIYNQLLQELSEEEIRITEYQSLDEHQQEKLRDHFQQNIFPMLTPLAMDPSHPFPFISNLTLNLLVTLRFPGGHDLHMARVKVPVSQDVSSRLIKVGEDYTYVTLDDLIANNLDMLFPGMAIESCDLFRVTRNANVELDQEAASDLLETIESELRERHFAPIVRLETSNGMNAVHRGMLAAELGLNEEQDVYTIEGMMALRDLFELTKLNLPELHDTPHHPVDHPQLAHDRRNIFHILRDHQGLLLQHPYESFSTTVERFLRTAAEDPKVLAIKMTLYRTSADGNVLDSLTKAARNGKQVAVLVELKARFDEAANIRWARRLEQAGIHVTYGVLGLKTHSKLIMVIRKDYSQLRRYYHIGTGNYHAGTARLYTDLGLLGCDEEIGKDLTEQFNYLTGYSPPPSYRKILAAPYTLKQSLLNKIEREIKIHRESSTGHIQLKMNALEDPDIVKSLYKATQAGVKVELIVRDTCRFRPGIKGLSESGSVVSIVGRFLEHSRITYFHNGGDEEYFIGSADLMRRNLKQRVEVLVPVEAPALRQELRLMLDVQLGDKHNAWDMQSDGTYIRRTPAEEDKSLNCQETLIGVAERRLEAAKKHREKRMREKLMTHFKHRLKNHSQNGGNG
ncbi:MAG: polyphosphate kinase 1 [Candidatus Thiodiazotropha taylori]|nr:polyphosphate kinase 1 [Candidatus Thiodiazotropha taylori]MCG8107387.1 polyphosphate kinase 1 [Candidatus Thiodiazotropha taylori]MCG8111694.1 polyphosphate kinase 1 [Candidatus Thiodiazotropha taylori]MCW4279724.1 polyphosphate kinase 1 [Candidatus Thiodiazotropha taylori]MCW4284050.1 polyphosphate kinase 1 [Candidatus Thiodiazotropha taylori]